jgi:hypothetical protein
VSLDKYFNSDNQHLALSFVSVKKDSQSVYYLKHWARNQRELYDMYLEQELQDTAAYVAWIDENLSEKTDINYTLGSSRNATLWHRWRAFERSIQDATGRHNCRPNIAAGCKYIGPIQQIHCIGSKKALSKLFIFLFGLFHTGWFWFTVMTTIGYGNMVPESEGGKIMVFTLGFLCILLFGVASARAGYVIASLLHDFLADVNSMSIYWPNVSFGVRFTTSGCSPLVVTMHGGIELGLVETRVMRQHQLTIKLATGLPMSVLPP